MIDTTLKGPTFTSRRTPRGQAMRELDRLERLANRMDTLFRLPGTNIRVGLDSIIGLVPGLGDTAAMLPSGYIIWRAKGLGAPPPLLARMIANTGVDFVLGSIPLIGDLFDVGFKANRRNTALLRQHLEELHGPMSIDE